MLTRLSLCLLLAATVGTVQAAESAKAAKLANTVFLDATGVKNLRLKTVEAEEQTFEETVFALGRIEVVPARRAAVSSRIAGRVVELKAVLGEPIAAEAIAARIESRLPGSPPPVIDLKVPAGGIVTEIDARLGDPVEPDRPLLEITDLSEVFAVARVPEHQASSMQAGSKAHIRVASQKDAVLEGTLLRFGTAADRSAGTVDAVFILPNPQLTLRPGMRAEFSIVTGKREGVMSVPRSALQGEASDRFLYVADDGIANAFVKVPVEVGVMNDRFVEITRGLLAGDKVVTDGAYSLAFAGKGSVSLKEALDAAHGHEHNADGSELGKDKKTSGHAEDDGHDHGSSEGGKLSFLTLFSLVGNGVLLVLLVVATTRRSSSAEERPSTPATKPHTEGADHAE